MLVAGFTSFGASLDRNPVTYVDEPNFNWAAISYLDGHGFRYNYSSHAPHRDDVWAYHGQFFPRMQVVTFSMLGVSRLAARLPQYVACYAAIAILAALLVRSGYGTSAVVLCLAWLGDRSSQEALYGRMEGLALLSVVVAFVATVKGFGGQRRRWAVLAGAAAATAVGFHPVTFPFPLAAFAIFTASAPKGGRLRAAACFVAGTVIPALLWFAGWAPHFAWAAEQFRWHTRMSMRRTFGASVLNLWHVLRWARYWPAALIVATCFVLAPFAIRSIAKARRSAKDESDWPFITIVAGCFAMAGLCCLCSSLLLPYYLIHFTIWPVLGLATMIERRNTPANWRRWACAVALVVVAAWLPSAAWNALRFRETLIYRRSLSPRVFAAKSFRALSRKMLRYPAFPNWPSRHAKPASASFIRCPGFQRGRQSLQRNGCCWTPRNSRLQSMSIPIASPRDRSYLRVTRSRTRARFGRRSSCWGRRDDRYDACVIVDLAKAPRSDGDLLQLYLLAFFRDLLV